MQDIHDLFTQFKQEFPEIHARHAALGQAIHEQSGPLPEKLRWLIKIAISGACRYERAVETHITKAKAAGATDEEILHTLLLMIPTAGYPTFMEAYAIFRALD